MCLDCFRRNVSFQDIGISHWLTRQIRKKGIREPTEIQQLAIPRIIAGDDVVINSETGTGKTLAYALPIVHAVNEIRRQKLELPRPYALILTANTDLQVQVGRVFRDMLKMNVIIASEGNRLRVKDIDVVISNSDYLLTYHFDVFKPVQMVVFDEADYLLGNQIGRTGNKDPLVKLIRELLNPETFKCFKEDLVEVIDTETPDSGNQTTDGVAIDTNIKTEGYSGSDVDVEDRRFSFDDNDGTSSIFKTRRQLIFAGATMPETYVPDSMYAVNKIRRWIPEVNVVKSENFHKVLPNVDMTYVKVSESEKCRLLVQMLSEYASQNLRVVVFADKADTVISLHNLLTTRDIAEEDIPNENRESFVEGLERVFSHFGDQMHLLHSRVSRHDRSEILQNFNLSPSCLLLTTDIVSRGIDFIDVDLVVQYDFARNVIDVLHRAGRTGRMGKKGKVCNFITEGDERLAGMIEERTNEGERVQDLFSRRRGLAQRMVSYGENSVKYGVGEDDSVQQPASN